MTPTEAADRLDHDQGGHLAAGQHVVADGDLSIDEVVHDPGVDTFVAAAEQAETPRPRRAPGPWLGRACVHLVPSGTAGGEDRLLRPPRTRARPSAPCRRHRRRASRPRCDADRWSRPADRGSGCPAAPCPRLPEEGLRGRSLDQVREDGEDIDAHARQRGTGPIPRDQSAIPGMPRSGRSPMISVSRSASKSASVSSTKQMDRSSSDTAPWMLAQMRWASSASPPRGPRPAAPGQRGRPGR